MQVEPSHTTTSFPDLLGMGNLPQGKTLHETQ